MARDEVTTAPFPGDGSKAPIERLLQMMDSALTEQSVAAEARNRILEDKLSQIDRRLEIQTQQFDELRSRFDSVGGRVGIDERLRSIEATLSSVAMKSDLSGLESQIKEIDCRVVEIEGIEEKRVKNKEDLGKEFRSSLVKWIVPILVAALLTGFGVFIMSQLGALRNALPTP